MKFLCDQMLGTLAKWLRVCGFDTFYANKDTKDEELLEICKKDDYTLITRDKNLIYAARREQIDVIEIQTTDLDLQIKKVMQVTKIRKDFILSRCLVCNNLLDTIDKKNAKGKVPAKVFENHEEFLFCKNCEKIYWKGTHYDKMLEKIKQYL